MQNLETPTSVHYLCCTCQATKNQASQLGCSAHSLANHISLWFLQFVISIYVYIGLVPTNSYPTTSLSLSLSPSTIYTLNRSNSNGVSIMLNTVRSIRTQSPTLFSSPQFLYQIRRNTSGLSFKQPPASATGNNHKDMDQQQLTNKRNTKTGFVFITSSWLLLI